MKNMSLPKVMRSDVNKLKNRLRTIQMGGGKLLHCKSYVGYAKQSIESAYKVAVFSSYIMSYETRQKVTTVIDFDTGSELKNRDMLNYMRLMDKSNMYDVEYMKRNIDLNYYRYAENIEQCMTFCERDDIPYEMYTSDENLVTVRSLEKLDDYISIENPICIPITNGTNTNKIKEVLKEVNEENEKGKVILVFSVSAVGELSMKMNDLKGCNVIFAVDPMSGNKRNINGYNIVYIEDVYKGVKDFTEQCKRCEVNSGGVFVRVTGKDVMECVSRNGFEFDKYESVSQPAMNGKQTFEMVSKYVK